MNCQDVVEQAVRDVCALVNPHGQQAMAMLMSQWAYGNLMQRLNEAALKGNRAEAEKARTALLAYVRGRVESKNPGGRKGTRLL